MAKAAHENLFDLAHAAIGQGQDVGIRVDGKWLQVSSLKHSGGELFRAMSEDTKVEYHLFVSDLRGVWVR